MSIQSSRQTRLAFQTMIVTVRVYFYVIGFIEIDGETASAKFCRVTGTATEARC